jgi:hypothetical protein
VEDKKRFYTWTHNIYYTLYLSGPNKNLMTRSEHHYLDRSLFDRDGLYGINTYYRLAADNALVPLFQYYLQNNPGWQSVGPAEPTGMPEEAD